MAIDILDPGPASDFPHLPRNPDGTLDTARVPVGLRRQPGPDGRPVLIDVTPLSAPARAASCPSPTSSPPPASD
ncbi:hypothetical protein ACFYE2_05725 [Kocuria sp. CPCC 205300]|uniref:hypothetical protein n=1 Tax=Kocuria sabuli TaxID=3071448 RepID=UPI0036DB1AFA